MKRSILDLLGEPSVLDGYSVLSTQFTCFPGTKSTNTGTKEQILTLLVAHSFTAIAPDNEDIIPFMTDAVNAQEQQASSLLMGLSINFASMLTRLSALYAEAQASL